MKKRKSAFDAINHITNYFTSVPKRQCESLSDEDESVVEEKHGSSISSKSSALFLTPQQPSSEVVILDDSEDLDLEVRYVGGPSIDISDSDIEADEVALQIEAFFSKSKKAAPVNTEPLQEMDDTNIDDSSQDEVPASFERGDGQFDSVFAKIKSIKRNQQVSQKIQDSLDHFEQEKATNSKDRPSSDSDDEQANLLSDRKLSIAYLELIDRNAIILREQIVFSLIMEPATLDILWLEISTHLKNGILPINLINQFKLLLNGKTFSAAGDFISIFELCLRNSGIKNEFFGLKTLHGLYRVSECLQLDYLTDPQAVLVDSYSSNVHLDSIAVIIDLLCDFEFNAASFELDFVVYMLLLPLDGQLRRLASSFGVIVTHLINICSQNQLITLCLRLKSLLCIDELLQTLFFLVWTDSCRFSDTFSFIVNQTARFLLLDDENMGTSVSFKKVVEFVQSSPKFEMKNGIKSVNVLQTLSLLSTLLYASIPSAFTTKQDKLLAKELEAHVKKVDSKIPITLSLDPVRYRCKMIFLRIISFIECRLPDHYLRGSNQLTFEMS